MKSDKNDLKLINVEGELIIVKKNSILYNVASSILYDAKQVNPMEKLDVKEILRFDLDRNTVKQNDGYSILIMYVTESGKSCFYTVGLIYWVNYMMLELNRLS